MNISGAGYSPSALLSQITSRLLSANTGSETTTTSAATTSAATSLLTSLDSNGDGSVSSDETLAFLQSALSSQSLGSVLQAQGQGPDGQQGPPPGPPPGGMGGPQGAGGAGGQQPPSLSDIDSDGDGTISQSEMEAFGTTTMGDSDTSKADKLFAAMDSDGDGSVSASEKDAFDAKGPGGHGQAETASSTSAESLADLMRQFVAAVQAYSATDSSSTASAATTTTSVAA